MTDDSILDRAIHAHNNHISTFCTHHATALPATSLQGLLIVFEWRLLRAAASGGSHYDR